MQSRASCCACTECSLLSLIVNSRTENRHAVKVHGSTVTARKHVTCAKCSGERILQITLTLTLLPPPTVFNLPSNGDIFNSKFHTINQLPHSAMINRFNSLRERPSTKPLTPSHPYQLTNAKNPSSSSCCPSNPSIAQDPMTISMDKADLVWCRTVALHPNI